MKKILVSLFVMTCFFTFGISVNAAEIDQETLIKNAQQEYLESINKSSLTEMTDEEENELTKKIDEIKREIYYSDSNSGNTKWYNPYITWTGYVYATNDGTAGHAGIGGTVSSGQSDLGYTIEANPGDGVKIYINRYRDYWRYKTTGGIYSVRNATTTKYKSASNWAKKQVGKDYNLNPFNGDSSFYCSELVYRAWEEQGITIGNMIAGVITPSSIMNHSNTIMSYAFTGN